MKRLLILVFVFALLVLGTNSAYAQGGFGGVHAASEFTSSGNYF